MKGLLRPAMLMICIIVALAAVEQPLELNPVSSAVASLLAPVGLCFSQGASAVQTHSGYLPLSERKNGPELFYVFYEAEEALGPLEETPIVLWLQVWCQAASPAWRLMHTAAKSSSVWLSLNAHWGSL